MNRDPAQVLEMEYFWPSRNFESVRQRLDPSLRGVLLASVRPSLILGRGRIGQINPTTKSGQTYMTASKFGCLSVCQSVCRPQRKSSLGGWAVRIVLLAVRLGGLLSLVSPALQAGRQTAALRLCLYLLLIRRKKEEVERGREAKKVLGRWIIK